MTETIADRAALLLFWRAFQRVLRAYTQRPCFALVLAPAEVCGHAVEVAIGTGLTIFVSMPEFTVLRVEHAQAYFSIVPTGDVMPMTDHGAVASLLALMPAEMFVLYAQHALQADGDCLCISPMV